MPRNINFYGQAKHSVVVQAVDASFSRNVKDFMDGDDSITIEPFGDRVAITQGFDKATMSVASIDGGTISINLKPTSPEVGFFNALFNRQRTTPILVNVTVYDGVEAITSLLNAAISKDARNTGGPTLQGVRFSFMGSSMAFDESEG